MSTRRMGFGKLMKLTAGCLLEEIFVGCIETLDKRDREKRALRRRQRLNLRTITAQHAVFKRTVESNGKSVDRRIFPHRTEKQSRIPPRPHRIGVLAIWVRDGGQSGLDELVARGVFSAAVVRARNENLRRCAIF